MAIPIAADGDDAARAFYGGLLGLDETDVPPKLDPARLIWFRAGGGLELHLQKSGVPATGAYHYCLLVDEDLDELRRRLEAAGVATTDEPEIVGRPRFVALDPFGNRVELTRFDA